METSDPHSGQQKISLIALRALMKAYFSVAPADPSSRLHVSAELENLKQQVNEAAERADVPAIIAAQTAVIAHLDFSATNHIHLYIAMREAVTNLNNIMWFVRFLDYFIEPQFATEDKDGAEIATRAALAELEEQFTLELADTTAKLQLYYVAQACISRIQAALAGNQK